MRIISVWYYLIIGTISRIKNPKTLYNKCFGMMVVTSTELNLVKVFNAFIDFVAIFLVFRKCCFYFFKSNIDINGHNRTQK